ncbi:hypothetical protein ABIF24_004276 [Bradyrhizobium elkanii]
MKYRQTDSPPVAAAKASFSTSTAYRIEQDRRLPSQKKAPRGRRRPDPLARVFETISMRCAAHDLSCSDAIASVARFHGEEQEVIFRQTHEPGQHSGRRPAECLVVTRWSATISMRLTI